MESAGEQANNSRTSFKSRSRLGSPKVSRGQLHPDPHAVLQKHAEVLKDLRKVDLATRKSYYLQLIEDLKIKNEQLDAEESEQEYRQKLKQLPDETTVQDELEKLNQQKRVTDMDIIDTENRIRHLLAEQEALEKDVVNFDFRTRKILEARKKKTEWEENTTVGLQQAEKERDEYLKMLVKRDQERAQTIAELRAEHDQLKSLKSSAIFGSDGQPLPSVGLKPDAEKKITGELFDLITAYETYVKQHKKLIAKNASIKDSTVFEKYQDKVTKLGTLQENLQQKQQTILTSDSKLQQLKKLEEDLIQQKYVSLTRTEHYKNVYMDVVNSKIEQTKVNQLLETPKPLPHVTVSAKDSLHKILKNGPSLNEVAEPKPHVFTGPTKFVKANFGNHTQDRINKSKQFQHRDEIFNSLVNTSNAAPSGLDGRLGSKRAIETKPSVSRSSVIIPANKERFHSPKPRAVVKEFEPTMRFASPSGSKFVRKQDDTSYLQKNRLHRASSPSGVIPVTRNPIQAASRADVAKKPLRQGPLSRINEQNPSETTSLRGDVTSDGTKTASQYSPKHSVNNGATPQTRLRSPASRVPGMQDRVMLKPSASKQQVPKAIPGGRRKDDSKTDQSISKLDISHLKSAPEPQEPTLVEPQVLAPSGTFKEKPSPRSREMEYQPVSLKNAEPSVDQVSPTFEEASDRVIEDLQTDKQRIDAALEQERGRAQSGLLEPLKQDPEGQEVVPSHSLPLQADISDQFAPLPADYHSEEVKIEDSEREFQDLQSNKDANQVVPEAEVTLDVVHDEVVPETPQQFVEVPAPFTGEVADSGVQLPNEITEEATQDQPKEHQTEPETRQSELSVAEAQVAPQSPKSAKVPGESLDVSPISPKEEVPEKSEPFAESADLPAALEKTDPLTISVPVQSGVTEVEPSAVTTGLPTITIADEAGSTPHSAMKRKNESAQIHDGEVLGSPMNSDSKELILETPDMSRKGSTLEKSEGNSTPALQSSLQVPGASLSPAPADGKLGESKPLSGENSEINLEDEEDLADPQA